MDRFEPDADTLPILDAIARRPPAAFVLGRAGTGKTRLLREIAQVYRGKAAIVAPTGLAALNAGGQTIHSFFGLSPFNVGPTIDPRRLKRKLLRGLDLLLVDEVSMVRADLVDAMDAALRTARGSPLAFGGASVIFFGDFLQLPPVVTGQDGHVLHELGYASPFAFDAFSLREAAPEFFELSTVHRQRDPDEAALLGRVRSGDAEALEALNAACVGPHRSGAVPVLLTSTNRLAEQYNLRGIESLNGAAKTFSGVVSQTFGRDRFPAPEALTLKPAARVMAVRNDAAGRYVNGSLGVVEGFGTESVFVRFDGAREAIEIEPASWESVRYDLIDGAVKTEIVGSYKQLPLTPAWALTVHKAQGLTLQDVRVDLGAGAFASGQAYVAVSRCRALAGLSLARPLRPQDLRLDPALERFV